MPADIGQMFYTGKMPWHGEGLALAKPANLKEALSAGGLNWEVGMVDLLTADDPPSPVPKRMAIVRQDLPAGHEGRVLGVVHRGFKPVQNRDAANLFDAIFGQGQPVYHTGGYLRNGDTIWLLAKLRRDILVGRKDPVETYALLANSHDGSMALNISLTTVRVVCSNTLAMALQDRTLGRHFRRAHQGTFREHAAAAREFFAAADHQIMLASTAFNRLSQVRCDDAAATALIKALLPEPTQPRNLAQNPGLRKAWENRRAEVELARQEIARLRTEGLGMDLEGSAGTYWGILNAVLEYVDHHQQDRSGSPAYSLLGDGMALKERAFTLIQAEVKKAA